jgi:hypothetical protein
LGSTVAAGINDAGQVVGIAAYYIAHQNHSLGRL